MPTTTAPDVATVRAWIDTLPYSARLQAIERAYLWSSVAQYRATFPSRDGATALWAALYRLRSVARRTTVTLHTN